MNFHSKMFGFFTILSGYFVYLNHKEFLTFKVAIDYFVNKHQNIEIKEKCEFQKSKVIRELNVPEISM
jgi:hypothetical protein